VLASDGKNTTSFNTQVHFTDISDIVALEQIIEAVMGLFIIAVFLTTVFPELAKVTGSDMSFMYFALIILAIGVIASIFKGR
jgi:hypothetical protein